MNVIQTNFEGDLGRITVFTPGRIIGQRTDFERADGKGRVSLMTSALVQQTADLAKYKGYSIIQY